MAEAEAAVVVVVMDQWWWFWWRLSHTFDPNQKSNTSFAVFGGVLGAPSAAMVLAAVANERILAAPEAWREVRSAAAEKNRMAIMVDGERWSGELRLVL